MTTNKQEPQFPVPQSIAHLIQHVEDLSEEGIKRVRVHFTNGYAVSIIQGSFSYGLEIALFNRDGEMDGSLLDMSDQGDDVLGWCTPETVTYYMKKLANL